MNSFIGLDIRELVGVFAWLELDDLQKRKDSGQHDYKTVRQRPSMGWKGRYRPLAKRKAFQPSLYLLNNAFEGVGP